MDLAEKISDWIRQQVTAAGKKGVVVGLSGGIDSAVVGVLAKKAMRDNVIGLILPCGNDAMDEELAAKLADRFRIKTQTADLYDIYTRLCAHFTGGTAVARANLKPRLRMMALYYFANTLDYLVAGTGNKSELIIGYFTKYGDGGCDILPLAGLLKTEVRKLAKDLHIPGEIIKRPPSAGLWEGQTDEDEIGISYKELDSCLIALEKGKRTDSKNRNLAKVKLMVKNSQHKRKKIPIFQKT